MKRITYISKFARPLSSAEIDEIASISVENNRRQSITGVLLSLAGIFFQVIEGPEAAIDALFEKLSHDPRHTEVLGLKVETDIKQRSFPGWSMKTIDLDANTELLVHPIKTLLQTITDSHRILEKYTQPTILKIISQGINPLSVLSRKLERIILFSDIIAFSLLSEQLEFDEIDTLVSSYFTVCTRAITRHGGEVAKFIGDGLMAYFDADQADKAIEASLEILQTLAELRANAPQASPLSVLYSGIGLSRGMVIEGNIGSYVKMDYTILGDAVNIAARLEGLTRRFKHALILSQHVLAGARDDWRFRSLGRQQLKGKDDQLEIFTLDDPRVAQPENELIRGEISAFFERR